MNSWKQGYSLPQTDYIDPAQFRADMAALAETQWLLVDHVSRIPAPGDWFTTQWGEESLIIVRGQDGAVRGFYNVCRHRGSRICLTEEGRSSLFVCPYHAWSYALDGSLRGAALMPEDFSRAENGLVPVRLEVYHGLIFIFMGEGGAPDFGDYTSRFGRFLAPHGLDGARIAARERVNNAANWKLVIENFFECYHCKPSHPTYCSVHDQQKLLAFGAGPDSGQAQLQEQYKPVLDAWTAEVESKGGVAGMWSDGPESLAMQSAARVPIARNFKTESLDGEAVAPLMGHLADFDGGQTAVNFNPLAILLMNNDHAVIFRIVPVAPLSTDFEMIWLVDGKAREDEVDLDRMTQLWKITVAEDKTITENNQKGVMSRAYRSGRLSGQEARIADFGIWYHRLIGKTAGLAAQ